MLGLLDGTDVKPTLTKDQSNLDEVKEWDARDKKARAQITLCVSDEPLNSIIYATTAKQAYDKLRECYEGTGKQTIALLTSEIFRGTFTDDAPMEQQLNSLRQRTHILKTLGFELPNWLIAVAIVTSLPDSYHVLRTILMTTQDTLTTEHVIAQTLTEERARSSSSATALLAKASHGKSKPKDDDKHKIKCDYCKKKGHKKDVCNKRKQDEAEKEKGKEKEKNEKSGDITAKVAVVAPSARSEDDEYIRLFMAEQLTSRPALNHRWIIDSGASSSMSSQHTWFSTYTPLASPKRVWLGDKSYILATGVGRIKLEVTCTDGTSPTVIIPDVYYIPELHGNLLSVSRFTRQGGTVAFSGNACQLTKGQITVTGQENDGLYILDVKVLHPETAKVSYLADSNSDMETSSHISDAPIAAFTARVVTAKADLNTWHRRLGHVNTKTILSMDRHGVVSGMEITGEKEIPKESCTPCFEGKQTREPILKETDTENPRLLHRVYLDVCGHFQTLTRNGHRYFVTYIDAKSHYVYVNLLKTKGEALQCMKAYIERVEVLTGERVNFFCSDGGGEYESKDLESYFRSRGIHHEKTLPDTPQENGVAERMNWTLLEMARCLLRDAGLPETYWGHAIQHSAHIIN